MTALITTLALLIAAALQARLPTFSWLGGLRIELLPALIVYGALTLPRSGAVILALCAGFIQDGLSAGPFGVTAFVYAAIVLALDALRESVDRELPPVQMMGGALAATTAAVVACCFVGITFGVVFKIIALGILSAVVTPILFFVLDQLRDAGRARSL